MKEAIKWLKDWRTTKCIFESDDKLLVDAFHRERGRSNFDIIVKDCSDSLRQNVSVVFASRFANSVAHVLAQTTYFMSGLMKWISTAPTFISCNLDLDTI